MLENFLESYDITGYVNEYVTHKLFDVASIGFRNALKRINKEKDIIKLEKFDKEDCIEYISQHISDNFKWATNISFRDATKPKKITDIFIDLDLFISPLKLRIDLDEKIPKIPISNILSDTEKNVVLLGQPGAGKTTSAKKIFIELITREREVYETFSFPLVIRLKDLRHNEDNNGLILFKEILNTLGIFYTFERSLDESMREKILVHIFKDFIERLDVLIILDGYDEIYDKELKSEIIRNLRLITNSLLNSRYILTSRSADYDLHIENSKEYEICHLNESQINDFVFKWINDETKSEILFSQLKSSPYWDTTMRPLTLAHLCALYERNNSIPEKPKSVYKKIIQLLLEDWSNQRSIKRSSLYAKFEVDRKMDFLSRFAYELTIEFDQISFDSKTLELIYSLICDDFGLPKTDSVRVINEIESHNGLVLQTGTDNFEFAHKSLLEYLVSDYIVKLPILIGDIDVLRKMPNELAICIAISSNPSITYFELIVNIMGINCTSSDFLLPFLSRLLTEKPNFEPNILFSITNIYILNQISKRKYEIENKIYEISISRNSHNSNNFEDEDRDFFDEREYHDEEDEDRGFFDEREYNDEEIESLDDSLEECALILESFKNDENFKKSLREIKNYYQISNVVLKENSSKIYLKKWGETHLLKTTRSKVTCKSIKFELPDNLILIGSYKKRIR